MRNALLESEHLMFIPRVDAPPKGSLGSAQNHILGGVFRPWGTLSEFATLGGVSTAKPVQGPMPIIDGCYDCEPQIKFIKFCWILSLIDLIRCSPRYIRDTHAIGLVEIIFIASESYWIFSGVWNLGAPRKLPVFRGVFSKWPTRWLRVQYPSVSLARWVFLLEYPPWACTLIYRNYSYLIYLTFSSIGNLIQS